MNQLLASIVGLITLRPRARGYNLKHNHPHQQSFSRSESAHPMLPEDTVSIVQCGWSAKEQSWLGRGGPQPSHASSPLRPGGADHSGRRLYKAMLEGFVADVVRMARREICGYVPGIPCFPRVAGLGGIVLGARERCAQHNIQRRGAKLCIGNVATTFPLVALFRSRHWPRAPRRYARDFAW
jgi:hypothetical protein